MSLLKVTALLSFGVCPDGTAGSARRATETIVGKPRTAAAGLQRGFHVIIDLPSRSATRRRLNTFIVTHLYAPVPPFVKEIVKTPCWHGNPCEWAVSRQTRGGSRENRRSTQTVGIREHGWVRGRGAIRQKRRLAGFRRFLRHFGSRLTRFSQQRMVRPQACGLQASG